MILSLRGTNGSGKSTVVRDLLKLTTGSRPIYGVLGARLPEAYELTFDGVKQPLYLIGPYQANCGGCDFIKTFELVPELIQKYAVRGHVLFEGLIVCSTYGQIGEMLERWKKDAVWVFLTTSLEECTRRVVGRRAAKSNRDEFDNKNLRLKHEQIIRLQKRVEEDGVMRAVATSSTKGAQLIYQLLRDDGNNQTKGRVRKGAIADA